MPDVGDRVQAVQRFPALDGLRGVAILMVVVYHVAEVLPHGSWGVLVFFVLSGFLITRLLVIQRDRTGRIDLVAFYQRRAWRLLPALVVVVAAFLALGGAWSDAWPPLAYVANYAIISGNHLAELQPTWSLAVEEHFYLVWPLVIALLSPRSRFAVVAGVLAVAVVWRAAVLATTGNLSWVYHATDTNAFAILAGCVLAVAHVEGRIPVARAAQPWALATVVGASAIRVWPILWVDFVVVALASVAVWQALSGSSILEAGWLRWLGRISYGLYLWHALILTNPGNVPALPAVAGAVVVAAASWYLIEHPFLSRGREREAVDRAHR